MHCSAYMHVLACGHLIATNARTPCATNCTTNPSPPSSPGSFEYTCGPCRTHNDLRLLTALHKLGRSIFLTDPLALDHVNTNSLVPYISLHSPALPTHHLQRLNDPLPGVKVFFKYTPSVRLLVPPVEFAYAFVLRDVWERFLALTKKGGGEEGALPEMGLEECVSLVGGVVSNFEEFTERGRQLKEKAREQAELEAGWAGFPL